MLSRLLPTCVVAVLVFLVDPSRASAEFVTLKYDGSVNPTVTTSLQPNAPTGPFSWHDNNLPPNANFPPPTSTFCIEPTGSILPSVGTSVVFDVRGLAAAPTIGTAAKANAVTELYGRFYQSAWGQAGFTGSSDSVAFQLALWEIITDGPPTAGNTNELSNGTFRVSSGIGAPYTTAKSWLNQMNGDASSFNTRFSGQELVALVAPAPGAKQQDCVQDQIALRPNSAVPAPPGVILAGIGFLGLLGRARLSRRKATA
ncbi:MAG TPA: hypothetical protein VKE74_27225 [Gemmataceae bacterium]|nr:hypothetical protein [Gemmataceae bacterium]